MKTYFITFILAVLFLTSTFSVSFAQIDWNKYDENPVLDSSSPGDWDDFSLFAFSILEPMLVSVMPRHRMGKPGHHMKTIR
jgi:hypothetical protein